jgi:hypothetical protein
LPSSDSISPVSSPHKRGAANVNLDVKAEAEHALAEEIVRARFFDGVFENPGALGKFAADVNVGGVNVEGETADQHALD